MACTSRFVWCHQIGVQTNSIEFRPEIREVAYIQTSLTVIYHEVMSLLRINAELSVVERGWTWIRPSQAILADGIKPDGALAWGEYDYNILVRRVQRRYGTHTPTYRTFVLSLARFRILFGVKVTCQRVKVDVDFSVKLECYWTEATIMFQSQCEDIR